MHSEISLTLSLAKTFVPKSFWKMWWFKPEMSSTTGSGNGTLASHGIVLSGEVSEVWSCWLKYVPWKWALRIESLGPLPICFVLVRGCELPASWSGCRACYLLPIFPAMWILVPLKLEVNVSVFFRKFLLVMVSFTTTEK